MFNATSKDRTQDIRSCISIHIRSSRKTINQKLYLYITSDIPIYFRKHSATKRLECTFTLRRLAQYLRFDWVMSSDLPYGRIHNIVHFLYILTNKVITIEYEIEM